MTPAALSAPLAAAQLSAGPALHAVGLDLGLGGEEADEPPCSSPVGIRPLVGGGTGPHTYGRDDLNV